MKVRLSRNPDDAYELGEGLRRADRMELEAHGWTYPFSDALLSLLETADKALTLIHRGEIIAIATVHVDPEDVPWISMLGTDEIARHPVAFIRACRDRISYLEDGYSRMVALTDKRNKVHHRFLTAFGYQFLGEVEINGHPFLQVFKSLDKICATPR